LVAILVVYAVLGTIMTFGVFGKPMIGLNFQQLRREADFRFALIRVRENAEAIAFYQGEARELSHVTARFAALYANYKRLLRRTLGLNLFQYSYTFVTYALPSVVIAPRIISGELEVGRAIQAGGAFAAMLGALTVFVDRFETLSGFAAGVERLHQLDRLLDRGEVPAKDQSFIESVEGPEVSLEAVTLSTPGTGRLLVEGVTLGVAPRADLVIVGQSGGGKSSLLRAVAGLWRRGSGTIVRPNLSEMLFLPQRPYMLWGSLREQLLYPNVERRVDDAELQQVLTRVNMASLVERCGGLDAAHDFAKMLSVGEQQRLAIARVLLAAPRYAILDEATSALDAENEAMLYAELKRTQATLISVTHHAGLLKYHSQVLELLGDGRWALHDAASFGLDPALEDVESSSAARGLASPPAGEATR
jgi:vitamin B12/bleomycin/antimicrobial peptide transport system ATP-binding/permease protein